MPTILLTQAAASAAFRGTWSQACSCSAISSVCTESKAAASSTYFKSHHTLPHHPTPTVHKLQTARLKPGEDHALRWRPGIKTGGDLTLRLPRPALRRPRPQPSERGCLVGESGATGWGQVGPLPGGAAPSVGPLPGGAAPSADTKHPELAVAAGFLLAIRAAQ